MCTHRTVEEFDLLWTERRSLAHEAAHPVSESGFARRVRERIRSYATGEAQDKGQPVATVDDIIGSIKVRRALTGAEETATLHMPLLLGDRLETGNGDLATVILADGTCLRMNQRSILEIVEVAEPSDQPQGPSTVALEAGELWAKGDLDVHTPAAMVRAEGSEFIVKITRDEESQVGVREGDALLANEYGAVRTTGNTASDAAPDRNPDPPHEVNTSALFDWARPFPRRVVYASQTGLEKEAEQLRQRLSEVEGDQDARSRLGVVLRKQGHMEEALAECIRAVEEAPGNAMCLYRLGLILRVQDPQRALEHLRRAVELDGNCALAWTLISAITRDDESLDWALQIQPDLVDALVLKGQRLRKAGATDEAIGFLEAAIDAEPSNPLPRHQLARLLTEDLGRLDEAELHCRQGLESDPMYAPLHARLGRIFLARGKPADAARVFEKALALPLGGSEPAWKQSFLSLLARAHAEMGDHERAESEFQAAVLMDPSFGPAQNEYALFLLEREKDLRTATQVAKVAAAFTPTNHSYRLTLGRAYFKLGCLDEALAQLEKARELYEGDAGVWYYLGVLYEARGEHDRAATAHNEALRILPSFSPSSEALRSLTDEMEQ